MQVKHLAFIKCSPIHRPLPPFTHPPLLSPFFSPLPLLLLTSSSLPFSFSLHSSSFYSLSLFSSPFSFSLSPSLLQLPLSFTSFTYPLHLSFYSLSSVQCICHSWGGGVYGACALSGGDSAGSDDCLPKVPGQEPAHAVWCHWHAGRLSWKPPQQAGKTRGVLNIVGWAWVSNAVNWLFWLAKNSPHKSTLLTTSTTVCTQLCRLDLESRESSDRCMHTSPSYSTQTMNICCSSCSLSNLICLHNCNSSFTVDTRAPAFAPGHHLPLPSSMHSH